MNADGSLKPEDARKIAEDIKKFRARRRAKRLRQEKLTRLENRLGVKQGDWLGWTICFIAYAAIVILACVSLLTQMAYADASITRKGYYEVFCNDTKVSQHSERDKAIQSALNQPAACVLRSPEVAIESTPTQSDTQPLTDIESMRVTISWEAPATRVDGSALKLTDIAFYRIYVTRKDEARSDNFEVSAVAEQSVYERTYLLAPGEWTFAASVIDTNGAESEISVRLSKTLPEQDVANPPSS